MATPVLTVVGNRGTYVLVDGDDGADLKGRSNPARFYITFGGVKQPYSERTIGRALERFGKYVESREARS